MVNGLYLFIYFFSAFLVLLSIQSTLHYKPRSPIHTQLHSTVLVCRHLHRFLYLLSRGSTYTQSLINEHI